MVGVVLCETNRERVAGSRLRYKKTNDSGAQRLSVSHGKNQQKTGRGCTERQKMLYYKSLVRGMVGESE